jgi:hypothetical protein
MMLVVQLVVMATLGWVYGSWRVGEEEYQGVTFAICVHLRWRTCGVDVVQVEIPAYDGL